VDGDSNQLSTASSRRSGCDTALSLTTSQHSYNSARKNSLRRARGDTRMLLGIARADPECGNFAGDERAATSQPLRATSPRRITPAIRISHSRFAE